MADAGPASGGPGAATENPNGATEAATPALGDGRRDEIASLAEGVKTMVRTSPCIMAALDESNAINAGAFFAQMQPVVQECDLRVHSVIKSQQELALQIEHLTCGAYDKYSAPITNHLPLATEPPCYRGPRPRPFPFAPAPSLTLPATISSNTTELERFSSACDEQKDSFAPYVEKLSGCRTRLTTVNTTLTTVQVCTGTA
jgi:hypothetical protein